MFEITYDWTKGMFLYLNENYIESHFAIRFLETSNCFCELRSGGVSNQGAPKIGCTFAI